MTDKLNRDAGPDNYLTKRAIVTIKRAAMLTGSSQSFFRKLLQDKKLKTYRIQSAVYVSLEEFEALAESKNK